MKTSGHITSQPQDAALKAVSGRRVPPGVLWTVIQVLAASVSLAAALTSCTKVKPAYNRENLKAIWVADIYDGVKAAPSGWTVQTFDDAGTLTVYGVRDVADGSRTWGRCTFSYEAYCCDLSYRGTVKGFFGIPVSAQLSRDYSFVSSEDSLMTLEMVSEKVNGETVYSDHNRVTMRKLTARYAATDSLNGIWQTRTRDGEPFGTWRMTFESSGGFILSVQDSEGVWRQVGDGGDTYSVYSDFVALTVTDNPYIGTEGAADVAFFTGLSARPKSSRMVFDCGGRTYEFTYVSSLE